MSEWISVKDRLPERGQEVIVYWHNLIKSGIYEISDATYDGDGLFYVHKANFGIDMGTTDVTHWMPRPILEPPKGVIFYA